MLVLVVVLVLAADAAGAAGAGGAGGFRFVLLAARESKPCVRLLLSGRFSPRLSCDSAYTCARTDQNKSRHRPAGPGSSMTTLRMTIYVAKGAGRR